MEHHLSDCFLSSSAAHSDSFNKELMAYIRAGEGRRNIRRERGTLGKNQVEGFTSQTQRKKQVPELKGRERDTWQNLD